MIIGQIRGWYHDAAQMKRPIWEKILSWLNLQIILVLSNLNITDQIYHCTTFNVIVWKMNLALKSKKYETYHCHRRTHIRPLSWVVESLRNSRRSIYLYSYTPPLSTLFSDNLESLGIMTYALTQNWHKYHCAYLCLLFPSESNVCVVLIICTCLHLRYVLNNFLWNFAINGVMRSYNNRFLADDILSCRFAQGTLPQRTLSLNCFPTCLHIQALYLHFYQYPFMYFYILWDETRCCATL